MLQMYKVFIQDRPIIFISVDEISNYDGFFISHSIGENQNQFILNLMSDLPKEIQLYIIGQNPKDEMISFFKNYDIIEAAGGIVKRKDKYLFIKRNGVWDLPKGKVEPSESTVMAAKREIEEECGIKNPTVNDLILITYHTYTYAGVPTLKKTFWYELSYEGTKKLKPQMEEGITKVEWIEKDNIEKKYNKTFASIKDVLDQYFSK
jgi:8-oxo-dGTP pyrophosphatase MutT (NUDIX family)